MDGIMPSWQILKHPCSSSQQQKVTTACLSQRGQSAVELLILVSLLLVVWQAPWAGQQVTILSYGKRVVGVIAQRVDWIWNYFLLNPLVG